MRSPQLGQVMARGKMSRTPPGLMSMLAWRVGPSYIVSEALEKGPGVPSLSDTSEIPEAPQGWQSGPLQAAQLQAGPENGHRQSRSVWVLHPQNAESDPWSVTGTTPGTDHVCSQRVI